MKKFFYTFVTVAMLVFLCQEVTIAENSDNGDKDSRYTSSKISAVADNSAMPEKGIDGDNLKNSRTEYIMAGSEFFTVTCGQIVLGDNGLYPSLPPDFFGPGSEPFTGTIDLEGAFSAGTTLPEPDLRLERMGDVFFSEPLPDDQTIPIEIVELNLQSVEPIVVNMGGVESFFDVFVEIELPDPDNSMQSIHKFDDFGGEFTSTFGFHPRFIFTQVDDPANQIMWSPFEMGYEPAVFTQPDPWPWTHSPIPNSFDPLGEGLIEMTSGTNNFLYLSPLLQREDFFMVEMTEEGMAGQFGGSGYNEGMWYEYPNYGWWNVWFYDHPVDDTRKKVIKANMIIEPRNPDFPTEIEIVFNWSTPEWPGYPEMNRPPLPSDVPDPQTEDLFIGRSETIFIWQGNLFEPIPLEDILFEIPNFNPEWLSVDIRGFNYTLNGNVTHTCFREENCPDPIQPPSGLYLRPTFKADPEPWYAWIGNVNDTTPVQLFADDPDEQIASVNFFYSHSLSSKSWNLFYTDNDGFSYPAPGPTNAMQEEADGWSGYLPHAILDQSLLPLFFMAEAVTIDGTVLDVVTEEPIMYDPTPPSSFESTLEEGFITDEDHVTVTITPVLANLDYVVFNTSAKPEWYQKEVPPMQQQDSMSCGPTALASCLKSFTLAGYPNIDGGLSLGDLADSLKTYVNFDPKLGTKDKDLASGAREWIEGNGGGFTVSGPMSYEKFNTTEMRNKMEGDALLNGVPQNIIKLFQWTGTDSQGNTVTYGHFMTQSSVHNSLYDGKRLFDYMDPATGSQVLGDINKDNGECSGFTNGIPDGAKVFSTVMICPDEPAPNPTGTGTVTQGPDFPPVDVPVEDTGKHVVRTRAVDSDGHKSERTVVITRVTRASCPDTAVRVGGDPFVPQGANPPGGTFNGPGFIDSLFHPVDTGYFPVYYSYTYDNGFTSVGDFTIRVDGLDFGDAPDEPYPTLFANNGARHIVDGVTYLGDTIDWEFDGQPTADADGDDVFDLDDEDGVTFLSALIPGKPAQINVNASVSGGLSAWIDFNKNGSWADPGEQIFADEMLSAGDNNLTFLVSTNALLGSTYARFRFSSQQLGLTYTGLAENGEVEDYKVDIIENQTIKWIQEPNTEAHGYHAHQQEGPDLYIADDWQCEGGLVTDLHWWGYYEFPNSGPCAGFRISLYENDASGSYNKPGAQIMTWDAPFGQNPGEVGEYFTGLKAITLDDLYYYYFVLPEPFAQTEGNYYWLELMALSANPQDNVVWEWQTNLEPIELSNPIQWDESGYETQLDRNMAFIITSEDDPGEDYDFGDAPDPSYPTLNVNNGARHFIDGQTYLGNTVDAEPDGLPNAAANGDDLNNVFDEDGVTFIDPFVVGETAELKVQASRDGYLNAWIDLNKNGSWAETGEHVFVDQALSSGMNTLTFSIPDDIKPGVTYIRFRFDTGGGLNYYGAADNGEVEDYRLTIYPPNWGYTPTGSSHIISIPASITFNCISLSQGDFMGTFYTDENGNPACGGAAYWDGINNQTLVAFGDDITTSSIKEGFDADELFTWRAYFSSTGTEEEIVVSYNPALPHSDGKFHDNGISALTSVVKKLSVDANAIPNPLCAGDTVLLSAVVSGGCGPNTFAWTSDPVGFTSSSQNPADTPTESTKYFVTVTNTFGDSDTDSVMVIVNDPPVVTCPDDFTVCLDDGPVTLTGGLPLGGTYSGTGVISGTFHPSVAGPGTHTITYQYTNPNSGCSASCQFQITVNTAPQLDCPPFMEACEDDPPVVLNTASPAGGIYSGTSVSFDGTDYWFDPSVGPGTYLITYCFTDPDTNCEACCEFNFNVYEKPEVTCPEDYTICIDTSPFALTGGLPTGGTYSGTGVSGGIFDPSAAGAGDHLITYTFTDPQTLCTNFCTFTITVIEVQVTCPDDFEICADDGPITLTGGMPAGGTYSGTGVSGGVFNPPSPFGGSYLITYTYVDPGSNCSGSCDFSITVNPSPQVDCPPFMEACEDDPPVLLNTASPAGGSYSGTGVSFDGSDYWFDPAVGVGNYIVTYCFTDPITGCENCCEFNFYVNEKPEVTCPEDFTVCIDTSPFVLTGGIPTGGDYSGTGVTYDGTDYWFDPAIAGSGDHIITYIYINPQTFCGDTCTFTITVIEVEVTCPDDMAVCVNDLSFVLSGASPAGGTYSGPGVSGGVFHPATAGVGVHTITYTYVEPGTNCSGSCDYKIEVYPQPQMDCPPNMEACEDDPPVLLNTAYPVGGEYTGTGVYFDGSDYWFDPSIGPGTYIVTYCFTNPVTGCDNCCEFNFNVNEKPDVTCPEDFTICIDTSPFTLSGGNPSGGQYTGAGVSYDGTDYWFDPSVAGEGDHEITYTYVDPQTQCINFCTYTITVIKVEVECPDDMEMCIDGGPVTLSGGLPSGGNYSGTGVAGGVFYPSVSGAGTFTLTYTYVEPGTNCSASCDFEAKVNPLPQVDCPPFMEACEDDPPVLLLSASPIGGEYSGTGVYFDGSDYYFDPGSGAGTYIITYCVTDPVSGCIGCCEFNFYVYEKPEVTCPDDFAVCLDTPSFVLTGGTPAGGEYSGTAVTFDGTDYWFDPAAAGPGTFTITYTYTDPQHLCVNFCTYAITVIETPEVICPDDKEVCVNDDPFELTGATPEGGTYSGAGVSGGFFNPSIAGVGSHTIIYTVGVAGTNCYGECEFIIVVKPQPQIDCPPFMEACEDDPPVLLNTAFPAGGIYSGTGVSFDGTDYWFDPAVGPGSYIITYCFTDPITGCENCCEFNFYVYEKPDVTCPEDFTICIDTSPFTLTGGNPSGGSYSGDGVTGNIFDPAAAGAGDHLITYTYTDPQTLCTNFCTFTITVIEVQVTCPDDFEICADDGPITLTGGLPAGGTYSGTGVSGGVFNPPSPFGGSYLITYTYVDPGSNCSGSCDFSITVNPLPQVDCPQFMQACEDDPPVLLNTASPAGGIYSGFGVSFDGTDYWFDPAVGPGTYIVTYCFTEPTTNCEACCEFNFYVYEKPEVTCPEDFTICLDTSPFTLTGGNPSGGSYSGDGVTGNIFDPAVAGAGDHLITYTYTDPQTPCTNFCTFTITVIVVDVECPDDMVVCVDDSEFVLTGALPSGGSYSGNGVSGGMFSPSTAGVGVHTITYTYVEPGTNCSGSCDFTIDVKPLPQVDCPPFMEACEDDPSVLLNTAAPAGGEYSGTGVYDDGFNYYFDPGIGPGTYIVTYCFIDPVTNCEACCEFNFYVYEKPEVTCPEDYTVCIDTSPFTLTGGNPTGGVFSGTGVSGGVFNPAIAGEGDHIITYTYTDPQTPCIDTCMFTIKVTQCQVVPVIQGWGSLSSYLQPVANNKGVSVEDVLQPIWDELIVAQYFSQLIYPEFGINTMEDYTTDHGYILKTTEPVDLTIYGEPADPTVPLSEGWNVMPVVQECSIDAATVFNSIPELIYAVEVSGNGIYYPDGNIFTLSELSPGKSYYVKVSSATQYTYPGCSSKSGISFVPVIRAENATTWNDVRYTGMAHTVVFSDEVMDQFNHGDIVGAFTTDGNCAGIIEIADDKTGVVLFGDDITTAIKDGFIDGEYMTFRLYRPNTNEEFSLEVSYDSKHTSGYFEHFGLSVITKVKMSATGINEPGYLNVNIYPNPSGGIFNIEGCPDQAVMSIYNTYGEEIISNQAVHDGTINLSNQPNGVYIVKIRTDIGNTMMKLVKE